MCEDEVALVRDTGAKACYLIARSLAQDEAIMVSFMERVRAFKNSRRYTMRQTFIVMCESVFLGDPEDHSDQARKEAEAIFTEHFLSSFVELQSDRIVNVRIHASWTLAILYEQRER